MAVSIFIADPDTIFIELVRERLQSHQVLVTGSTTLLETLNFLRGIRSDLLVVDPRIESDTKLLQLLRTDWTETPTIIMASTESVEEQARQMGFEHVLRKSTSPDAILQLGVELLRKTLLCQAQNPTPDTLVVDDDPDVLGLFSKMLKEYGHSVRGAQSISEAMAALGEDTSDVGLVLLDVVVPGGSGLEFLRHIQKIERPPTVILVSGVVDEALAREAFSLGAFDYLVKPIDPFSLMIAVTAGIAQSQ